MNDKIWLTLAWWLPRGLVYWCAVRVGAEASQKDFSHEVPDIKLMEALDAWKKKS